MVVDLGVTKVPKFMNVCMYINVIKLSLLGTFVCRYSTCTGSRCVLPGTCVHTLPGVHVVLFLYNLLYKKIHKFLIQLYLVQDPLFTTCLLSPIYFYFELIHVQM